MSRSLRNIRNMREGLIKDSEGKPHILKKEDISDILNQRSHLESRCGGDN